MTTINPSMLGVIKAAGFTPPQPEEYEKPDPRGAEYGLFRVKPTTKSSIRVYYTKDDYGMDFTSYQDFKNWAKVCT